MEFDGAHPRAPSPLRPLKEQDMEIRVSPGSRTQSPSPSRGGKNKTLGKLEHIRPPRL